MWTLLCEQKVTKETKNGFPEIPCLAFANVLPMTGYLEKRAALVVGLAGRYSPLGAAQAAALFIDICALLQRATKEAESPAATFDASNVDRDEVIAWMRSLELGNPSVEVCWMADRAGLAMRLHDFIEDYDDLWFPSADDVCVVDATREWILEIDHEEQFTLWRPLAPWLVLGPDRKAEGSSFMASFPSVEQWSHCSSSRPSRRVWLRIGSRQD